jgi:hypothetical protein
MLFKKFFIGIASIAILATLLFACGTVSADDTYVTIDINPSIDLIVSGADKVLAANPLNEDGEMLLLDLDLVGEKSEDAIALIIDEAIDLGFIDIEAEETVVSVSAVSTTAELGETVRNRIMEQVNTAFAERAMMGKAVAKTEDASTVAAADALGVSPALYRLAAKVCELDDAVTMEAATQMTATELMAAIQTRLQENKDVAQELKDAFLAARELIRDEYLPQIEDLEAQIDTLKAEDGDTADLEAQLATLVAEYQAELAALRDEYHTSSETVRTQLRTEMEARISEHAAAVEAWRSQVQTRKADLEDAIANYQNGQDDETTTTETAVTTQENTATSGTGGN